MNLITFNIGTLAGFAWGSAKALIQAAEPYQPPIAGCIILAKLAWRVYKQKPLNQEVQNLNQRINRLSHVLRSRAFEERPEQFQAVWGLREDLRAEREEKKRQMSYTMLTFGQVPSLFFAHPGSNIYQSIHQLVGRGVQMHHTANPASGRMATTGEWVKSACSLAGGMVSLAGTVASLGRMTGLVDPDNRTSHTLTYLAIGVHALEGCLMAKDAIKNAYVYYRDLSNIPTRSRTF